MPKHGHIRHGSLQFYPRVRAKKILPRCNWKALSREKCNLLGFIGYKVGMASASVKDNTPHSLTKGKKIIIPVSILECPHLKILSVRVYKDDKVKTEILNPNLEKELKRKIKLPKKIDKKIEELEKEEFDDLRVIVYSQVNKTGIKKTPDIAEIGISGTKEEKLEFVKQHFFKEISVKDVFGDLKNNLVDIRGVTKGKGFQGSTKRFGLSLKSHKSEKGVRGAGSLGPWHPAKLDFRRPMPGQMGYFTRVIYNSKILYIGNIKEKDINPKGGFLHFGKIRTDYIILSGSVQGPQKRALLITTALRPSKKQIKKNYEFIELKV